MSVPTMRPRTEDPNARAPEYWIVRWGDATLDRYGKVEPAVTRGPYDKSTVIQACDRAWGMVAENMYAVSVGRRVARIQANYYRSAYHEAIQSLKNPGVYRYDPDTGKCEMIGTWRTNIMGHVHGVRWTASAMGG